MGYIGALQGFPIEAIAHGIRRFLRGEFEDLSKKFCPHPPELADIVRRTLPSRPATKAYTGQIYYYRQPASRIIERKCTKGYAFGLIDRGIHPRGSIWCPGPLDDRPDIGDLFGPDPSWRPAKPIPKPEKSAA